MSKIGIAESHAFEEQREREKQDKRLRVISISQGDQISPTALDIKRYLEERNFKEEVHFTLRNFQRESSDLTRKVYQYDSVALEVPLGNSFGLPSGVYIGYEAVGNFLKSRGSSLRVPDVLDEVGKLWR